MGSDDLHTDLEVMLGLLKQAGTAQAGGAAAAVVLTAPVLEMLRKLPAPVVAVRADNARVVFWNDSCEVITGYTAADVMARENPWSMLYPDTGYLLHKLTQALAADNDSDKGIEATLVDRLGAKHRLAWSRLHGVKSNAAADELWFMGIDVTQRSASDRALRQQDRLLQSVFGHLPDMVHLTDGEGRWLLANDAARRLFNLRQEEAVHVTSLALALAGHPMADGLRHSALSEEATWQSGVPSTAQELFNDMHGTARCFDVVRVPVFAPDSSGHRQHMLVVRRDITDARHAATKLELAGKVLDQSTDGIMIADAEHRVIMVNAAFTEITGFSADEVMGRDAEVLMSRQHDPALHKTIDRALAAQGRWSGEVWNRRKNGEVYPQWLSLSVLWNRSSDEITHYVAAFSDLSSSKAAEEKIAYLSTQDLVTGLPNRTQTALRAGMMLEHAMSTREQLALVVMDVDNFKMLNDSLGHAAGDNVLRVIGERLAESAGPHALVGRLSGDEFMALLPAAYGTAEAAHAVRNLMEAANESTVVGGLPMSFSISVGVAMFPTDGETFDALFGRADSALHVAKREGRATYHFASASMNDAALERLQMESALRRAIDNNELRLEYQPLIELASDRIVGVEALCRWDDPERGAVPPGIFIPVAEDCGLIQKLGGWVLKTATRQLRAWHEAGHPDLFLAVNLSARQFQRGLVLQQVETALTESGIQPNKLELELTESVLLHDELVVTNTLRQLKALGVKLAIDDFGTGYSSFAYLRRFKFDKIKIDQSFVRDLIDDPDNAAIVRGIISLALSLGLNVLAEGVETEPIAQRLRRLQCTHAQGYFFARPLRPEALQLLLANRSTAR